MAEYELVLIGATWTRGDDVLRVTEPTEIDDVLTVLDSLFGQSDVQEYVRDHYTLHGTEDCDHGECVTDFECEEDHREPDQDEKLRQLAQDWHDVMRAWGGVHHSIGLYRHCPDEKCRTAAELLGDR